MTSFANVLESVAKSNEDLRLVKNYSGKFMYGKTCYGIVGKSSKDILKNISEIIFQESNNVDETSILIDEMLDFIVDDMGLDVILYWKKTH